METTAYEQLIALAQREETIYVYHLTPRDRVYSSNDPLAGS